MHCIPHTNQQAASISQVFGAPCSAAGGLGAGSSPLCHSPGALAEDEGRGREDMGRSHGKGLQSRLAGQSLFNHMEQVYSWALKASGDHKEHPAQLLHTHHCRDLSLAQTCCMGSTCPHGCPQSQSPHCPALNWGSWPFAAAGNNSRVNTWPQPAHFRPSTACFAPCAHQQLLQSFRRFSQRLIFSAVFHSLSLYSFNWLCSVHCHYKALGSDWDARRPGGSRSRGMFHDHFQMP